MNEAIAEEEEVAEESPATEAEGVAETAEAEPGEETPAGEEPQKVDPQAEALKNRFKLIEQAKREQLRNTHLQRQIQQKSQQLTYAEQQLRSQAEQLAQREQRIAKFEKALESKDLELLQELGFDYVDMTQHHLAKNTPEFLAKQAMEENRRLRQELLEKEQRAQQHQQAQSEIRELQTIAENVVNIVDEAAEEFPELYEWAPERIKQEALVVRDQIMRRQNRLPSYNEVISILSNEAKREAGIRTERVEKRKARPSSENKSGTGSQAGGPNSPTITNQVTQQRLSNPRPKSEAELDAELIAQLGKVFGKGAKK